MKQQEDGIPTLAVQMMVATTWLSAGTSTVYVWTPLQEKCSLDLKHSALDLSQTTTADNVRIMIEYGTCTKYHWLPFLVEQCGAWKCKLYCPSGYNNDSNGCRQCSCKEGMLFSWHVLSFNNSCLVTCDYSGIAEAIRGCGTGCLRYDGMCFSCIPNCNQTGKINYTT